VSKHTERTLALLAKAGFTAEVVERWIPGAGKRRDYLGCIDIVAVNDVLTLGVQSCGSDFAEHKAKILAAPRAKLWLRAPERHLVLVGWRPLARYKKDGSRSVVPRFGARVQYFGLQGEKVVPIYDELQQLLDPL
jgi:hypothetical protein